MKRSLAEFIKSFTEDAAGQVEYDYERISIPGDRIDEAKALAISKGKEANVIEWAGVTLQEWQGNKRNGQWVTVERWIGDWDGFEQVLS